MKSRMLVPLVPVIALAVFSVSCATPRDPGDFEASSAGTYDELVAALHDNGFEVEGLDPIMQPFFTPEGRVLDVDGHQVQVYEYSNEDDALAEAATISSDGSSIGTTMVTWVEAPHFFMSGNLIVLYVGEEESVIKGLEMILGPQMAGR